MGGHRVRQTLVLYSSEIGLMVLTFGTGILNSRFLGPEQYGVYTFIITIVQVVSLFGGLGFAPSGARLTALAKSRKDEREIQGVLVLVGLVLGLCLSVVLTFLSPLIDYIFHAKVKGALAIGSILCLTAPLQLILERACRGANRIGILACLTILPKGLYLLGGLCIIFWGKLTANVALALYFGGVVGACLVAVLSLRVRFENVRSRIRQLKKEVRSYGFNVYLGGLADNSTFKLNNLLIAGYVDTTWLGFYSIASTMVSPMVKFSTSLSASIYRSLAHRDRIDKRVFLVNTVFLAGSCVFIALVARPLIGTVLTEKFLPATGLVYILVFTAFFQGMYQPINAFLGAHGKGRESKRISIIVSVVNLCVAATLIPLLGAYGAALGSSIAKLCEFLGNVYYYRKIIRTSLVEPIVNVHEISTS
jgi:O-antigen/teichoic acid export membrane protein